MKSAKEKLVMAALAGLMLGATSVGKAQSSQDAGTAGQASNVRCYGVNSCAGHAGCGVMAEDVAAVRKLLGDKEFEARFGKTKEHSCSAHSKCGASSHILNWTMISESSCKESNGIVIDGGEGQKVAKKL